NREALRDSDARLDAKELDIASTKEWRPGRGLLPDEDRPDFRQRARVLKQERAGHGRDEIVEAVIALEQPPPLAVAAAQPAAVKDLVHPSSRRNVGRRLASVESAAWHGRDGGHRRDAGRGHIRRLGTYDRPLHDSGSVAV